MNGYKGDDAELDAAEFRAWFAEAAKHDLDNYAEVSRSTGIDMQTLLMLRLLMLVSGFLSRLHVVPPDEPS